MHHNRYRSFIKTGYIYADENQLAHFGEALFRKAG